MIKNLVFDFDGMIIDTESTEFQAWQEIFREYGCELQLHIWADCIGRPHGYFDPSGYLEELIHCAVDRSALRVKSLSRANTLSDVLPILPGVDDMIAEAKRLGFGLGIASSSDRPCVQGHLERLGLLSLFDVIVCSEDTDTHKPDPAPYMAVLDRLGCRSDEAVAFEDSPNGINAAKAAGLFCVAVPNQVTRHLCLDGADLFLDSLTELSLETLLARLSHRQEETG